MTGPADNLPLLEARVRLDSLPVNGRTLDVAATEAQRLAIAERLGILSVEALSAHLKARPFRGGIEVSGTLQADVTQACVVSFEPVPEHIAEKLFRLFLHGPVDEPARAPGAEVFVDLEGDDAPDHFDGPEADLAEWLIETLSLALDPYPRKEGVEIDKEYRDEKNDGDSPFAALRSLKTDKD